MNNESVVTGSSGFIGKRLMSELGETATPAIRHTLLTGKMTDVTRRVFMLGAYGNLSDQNEYLSIIHANTITAFLVARSLLLYCHTLELLIYASSSSVLLPLQTPYSRSKRAAEEILLASGLPVAIVRPFSVTGVGEQKQHLIPTLIRSCLEGEPMQFCPQPVHDFIDVADVVAGMIRLADAKETGIFEFGSGEAVTNDAVRQIVEEECGSPANITKMGSFRSYDSTNWRCSNPASQFVRTKTLVQSIREMVEAYRAH